MANWYLAGEMARRLGVSQKALRLYEQAGLVKPLRTEAGWRAYGPDEQTRLHQILALKRLGLDLRRIGVLLRGELHGLDAVLAVQQHALNARRSQIDKALALLASARAQLAAGVALSPKDLEQLTKETVMSDTMSDLDWEETMQPAIDRHFTPQEQEAVRATKFNFNQEEVSKTWALLIGEARALQAKGDPSTPAAHDLARRWMDQVAKFTGGDPELLAKAGKVNQEVLSDPDKAAKMPFDLSLMQFVGEAWRSSQSNG